MCSGMVWQYAGTTQSFQEGAEEPVRATVVFYAGEDRKLLNNVVWGKIVILAGI